MKTVELFCGTKSFSNYAKSIGHSTYTVDNDPELEPTLVWDLLEDPYISDRFWNYCLNGVDVLWASPPCTAFSVASIGRHWKGGKNAYIPASQTAETGMLLVQRTLKTIRDMKPRWWFIENPRGVLRKMPFMDGMRRVTVSYCQYGDTRMKPTDIWTNADWWTPRPMCKNGDKCHEAAPRGSKTGTQGIDGARDRGRIPQDLFKEIFEQMPN